MQKVVLVKSTHISLEAKALKTYTKDCADAEDDFAASPLVQ